MAAAAYNAGPNRAERWLARARGASAAGFAESVDIDETERYVRLVLETYAQYVTIYGR